MGAAVYGESGSEHRPISVEGVGTLVAFLNTKGLERRREGVLWRLRGLQASEDWATLPEDLRLRVGEILAAEPQG